MCKAVKCPQCGHELSPDELLKLEALMRGLSDEQPQQQIEAPKN